MSFSARGWPIDALCPCGFDDPTGVRFCSSCGAPLPRSCPSCGGRELARVPVLWGVRCTAAHPPRPISPPLEREYPRSAEHGVVTPHDRRVSKLNLLQALKQDLECNQCLEPGELGAEAVVNAVAE